MTPQERMALALAYQQRKPNLGDLSPEQVTAMQAPTQQPTMSFLDRLSETGAGIGKGLANTVESMGQMVTAPIETGKEMYRNVSDVVSNPSLIADALKQMGEKATSSPAGFGEVVGENINPRNLLKGLATPNVREIYMPTRPKMPEQVGKRFATTDIGNLLAETPFNIEDYLGASIGVVPWDNSSRNRLITNVSETQLQRPVLTHGGQAYARDVEHQQRNIAGASASKIVDRIADRVENARQENLARGGTGVILQTPMTMGSFSENYSVTPSEILLDLIDQRRPSKAKINEINKAVKTEYPDFRGIETETGRAQMMGGVADVKAPGQLRKTFVDAMYKEPNEKYFGFNRQDISNAITDPSLMGVGRGYGMNTIVSHGVDPLTLTRSANASYPVDFSGTYAGTLGNIPVQEFMPETYNNIFNELSGRTDAKGRVIPSSAVHDQTLGALGTRAKNVFQFVDEPLVEALMKWRKSANLQRIQ